MAKYEIPEIFGSGFSLIGNCDDKTLDLILETINSAELGDQPDDLVKKAPEKLKIDSKDLRIIFGTIFTLINFLIETDKKSSTVLEDIVNSYIEEFPEAAKTKDFLLKSLNKIVYSQGKVTQTIKGYNLLSEGEKVYMKSRIISDMRLVFDTNVETKTRGVVLIHQLKLTYRESGEWKEIFIAMDSNDLNNLNENILRAVEKEKLILSNTFTKELSFIKPKK